jgi:uncharacterized protein YukE
MSGGQSGQQQPEQRSFLGFPARPEGDGGAVQAGRHHWYELAGEIQGAFADIERAMGGMQWSGDARTAFDALWSQFSGHATEASQHSHEMGDSLFRIGGQIDDAQHQWDLAMAAMVASTAIGIGLTFFTFGISDAVAEGAAAAAVGTMEAVCTALDVSLEAGMQVLMAAVRIGAQLAVKFTWQFTIGVVSQEGANLVQGRGGLGNLDLGQAAEFAGVSMLIPGIAGRVTIGGRQVLAGVPGAVLTGAATDAAVQGVEGVTEGKPFNVGEMLVSGALAAGGEAGSRIVGRVAGPVGGPPLEELPPPDTARLPTPPSMDPPAAARAPLAADLEAGRHVPWARSLNSTPRFATQAEQVRWYEENVRSLHADDPEFQRFDNMVGAWQGGSHPMFRNGVSRILSGEPNPWAANEADSRMLLDSMRAVPPDAPELYRGYLIKGNVHDAIASLPVGGELRLLPSSFSHDPGVAEHFADLKYHGPDEVSVILRQEAGAKSLFIQPMTPAGASSLWREGEWIGGGTYEVTGVHEIGGGAVMIDVRQVGDIGSLQVSTGGPPG